MKKIVANTLILLFIPLISFSQKYSFELKEILRIGEEQSDSVQYMFSGIKNILPLPNGNILVADASDAAIRVFRNDGNFIKKIGQRGRGPGDFHDVTHITIGINNEVLVLDKHQNRISFFDHNGMFLYSKLLNLKTFGISHLFFSRNNNEIFFVIRDFLNEQDNGNIVYRYDASINHRLGAYLNVFQHFFDQTNPLHENISKPPFYKSTRFGKKYMAIAPNIYTGTVGVLDLSIHKEMLWGTPLANFVEQYDWNKREALLNSEDAGFASNSNQTGKYFYKMKGTNLALVGNSQFLLQFYVLFEGKNAVPYLNIFRVNGEMASVLSLEDSPLNFIYNNQIAIIPHFLDEENNLYISDYYYKDSYPAVRVFKTNLNELLSE